MLWCHKVWCLSNSMLCCGNKEMHASVSAAMMFSKQHAVLQDIPARMLWCQQRSCLSTSMLCCRTYQQACLGASSHNVKHTACCAAVADEVHILKKVALVSAAAMYSKQHAVLQGLLRCTTWCQQLSCSGCNSCQTVAVLQPQRLPWQLERHTIC